ncbi:MAG: hypothetical protein E7390_06175 [Ruminococcaceae bacterium]|nr:hypothetical protein [Oscillospiraceae bacterium]
MNIPENSSVCFIGDSITAAEKYVRILVDFFVLHFPEKKIRFHNISIPGASIPLLLQNWDTLVPLRKPTHATVLFGMNDLHRVLYADSVHITEEVLEKREAAFSAYTDNMRALLHRLGDASTLIMTPTLHDESPAIDAPVYGGYDAALQRAGEFLKNTFSPVLDLHTPLEIANSRKLVPTVIGPDRVHPGNIGHAIIAKAILEKLGFENPRLPLWDNSITDTERTALGNMGILEDKSPKNPYSDTRSRTARRLIDFWYVEMNVLGGQGIDKNDTEKADAFLKSQLSQPIEEWRIKCYTDYMENRHTLSERIRAAEEAMENMYRA